MVKIKSLNSRFPYNVTKKLGEIIYRKGWHKPVESGCECKKETGKGAYRDVVILYETSKTRGFCGPENKVSGTPDNKFYEIIYLHQNCIMVKNKTDDYIIMDSCGYKTNTTRDRLRSYLKCYGIILFQRKGEWYLTNGEKTAGFYDGIKIRPIGGGV